MTIPQNLWDGDEMTEFTKDFIETQKEIVKDIPGNDYDTWFEIRHKELILCGNYDQETGTANCGSYLVVENEDYVEGIKNCLLHYFNSLTEISTLQFERQTWIDKSDELQKRTIAQHQEIEELRKENKKLQVRLAASKNDLPLFVVSEMLKNTQTRVQELEELIEFATDRDVLIVNKKDFPEHLQYLFKDHDYQPPQEEE